MRRCSCDLREYDGNTGILSGYARHLCHFCRTQVCIHAIGPRSARSSDVRFITLTVPCIHPPAGRVSPARRFFHVFSDSALCPASHGCLPPTPPYPAFFLPRCSSPRSLYPWHALHESLFSPDRLLTVRETPVSCSSHTLRLLPETTPATLRCRSRRHEKKKGVPLWTIPVVPPR